jgi:uncharacterized protein involved in exopolysaccharide biosynthesis
MHHRPDPAPVVDGAAAAPRRPAPELGALRDFWNLLLRRWPVMAAVFVLVTGAVVGAALLQPASWTAQATIMVKQGREFFYRAEVGDATGRPLLSVTEMVNSQVEILSSRELAEQVVGEMGVERLYPEMLATARGGGGSAVAAPPSDSAALVPAAVGRFQESLTVMDIPESSIIRISFENREPQVAADALNLLVEKFKDKHLTVFAEPAVGFLARQREVYEERLTGSEKALDGFRQEHAVYEPAEQRTMLLRRRMELETELQNAGLRVAELEHAMSLLDGGSMSASAAEPPPITEDRASMVTRRGQLASALQEADMRLAELRQQLVVMRPGGDAPGFSGTQQWRSIDDAFGRLLDLQLREKEALRNYNEGSRMVLGIREEIALVEAFLRDRGAYVREVIEAEIREELEMLVARRGAAIDQMEAVDAQIRAVDLRGLIDELSPIQARMAKIREELARNQEQIDGLDRLEVQLRRLQRQVELDEGNYRGFLAKFEAARLMEELDRQKLVNIAVVERAAPPVQPSSLSNKARAAIGAAVGLAAALAAAVFLELVGRS